MLTVYAWIQAHPTLAMILMSTLLGLSVSILTSIVLLYELILKPVFWLTGKMFAIPLALAVFFAFFLLW